MNPKPIRRIIAVDRNVDFHEILSRELEPNFSVPIETVTVEEFLKHGAKIDDALIVTSLYHLFSFQNTVADPDASGGLQHRACAERDGRCI